MQFRYTFRLCPGGSQRVALARLFGCVRVLRTAADAFGPRIDLVEYDFASADHWLRHGTMLPDDRPEGVPPDLGGETSTSVLGEAIAAEVADGRP